MRVRIAPSPTGYFHVGGARTALYNWCFARQHGGVFVLRIEDTDRERHQEEQYEGILEALRWLSIEWDEGPYRQSERRELYDATLEVLWDAGALYACDCTREAIDARTKGRQAPGYDGYCRLRALERGPGRALRYRVPDEGVTVVHDLIRGEVQFMNDTIEDFVVAKSNGDALFVLAVVADDRAMRITHVIRAEEHLPTTPKAVLIWESLNAAGGDVAELPAFAHLPVLVNERRQKISKRRDRVAIEDFRAQGYLPEAMTDYLALLGWSFPDGRELFSREELVAEFRLEDVNHSPAFFDEKKLLHVNGVSIRSLSTGEFTKRCATWASESRDSLGTAIYESPEWKALAPLVQERIGLLSEVSSYVDYLFGADFEVDASSFAKAVLGDAGAAKILQAAYDRFEALAEWNAGDLKAALEEIAAAHERKLGKAQAPVRVATLGRTVGLPLFESLEVLGRPQTLARLERAIHQIPTSA